MADFGITGDGRLIDLRPLSKGEGVNVWDFGLKQWVDAPHMLVGTVTDSKPIDEEAKEIIEAGAVN